MFTFKFEVHTTKISL